VENFCGRWLNLSRLFFSMPRELAPPFLDGFAGMPCSRFWSRRGWLAGNGQFGRFSRAWPRSVLRIVEATTWRPFGQSNGLFTFSHMRAK
jgi:hypothetical protein